MTQFSPKNVALGSLVLGGAGILIAIIGSLAGSEVIGGLGLALLFLCFCGLYVAYLLNVLRFWDPSGTCGNCIWTILLGHCSDRIAPRPIPQGSWANVLGS